MIDKLTAARSISDFFYFPDFYGALDSLEAMAAKENWNYKDPNIARRNKKNPILENYLHHTFKRLRVEYLQEQSEGKRNLIIYMSSTTACFNTGLFTPNYSKIFALFRPSKYATDKRPYSFIGFEQEASNRLLAIPELPRRANYFTDISDLIYDYTLPLRASNEHILQQNLQRFPSELISNPMLPTLFAGAMEQAKKRVEANYKIAVPTYYDNEICLMLPICLIEEKRTDLALAVKKSMGFYTAKTCLTLDMAYNDARLIARPDSDWLVP